MTVDPRSAGVSKPLIAAAVLLALLVAGRTLPLADWITAAAEALRGAGPLGMAGFVALYAGAALLLIPGSALTLVAGLVYGLGVGVALVVPASLLGAAGAFLLGRTLLRDAVARRAGDHPAFAAIDALVRRRGLRIVLLCRLTPLFPFTLLNYGLGATGVSFRDYFLASAVGMFPGTVLYVYLGTLIPNAATLLSGELPAEGQALRTALLVGGLIAGFALVVWIGRVARAALDEERQRAGLSRGLTEPPPPAPRERP